MRKDQTIRNIANKISIEKIQPKSVVYTIVENYYKMIKEDIVAQENIWDYKTFLIPSLGKFTLKFKPKLKKDEWRIQNTNNPTEGRQRSGDIRFNTESEVRERDQGAVHPTEEIKRDEGKEEGLYPHIKFLDPFD